MIEIIYSLASHRTKIEKSIVLGTISKGEGQTFTSKTTDDELHQLLCVKFAEIYNKIEFIREQYNNIFDIDLTVSLYKTNETFKNKISEMQHISICYEYEFFIPPQFRDMNHLKLKNNNFYEEVIIPYNEDDKYKFELVIRKFFDKTFKLVKDNG